MGANQQPPFEEMALFVRVVEAGSFSEVARQMGSTASAVSRSISRLESSLGKKLLHRTTRRVSLTPNGSAILGHCQNMVSAARSVVDFGGGNLGEPQGCLRVSTPKAIGCTVLHTHMKSFLSRYPKVDVQLILQDRFLDLVEHQIDVALRVTDSPPMGLIGRPLGRIEHCICASPDYLKIHSLPEHPHDLAGHSCISLGESPSDARWRFLKDDQTVVVPVRGRYSANNTGVRLDAVKAGVGIGSLPMFTAQPALDQGEIVRLLPDWRFINHYSGMLWMLYLPTRHVSGMLRVFIDHMVEHIVIDDDVGKIVPRI